jgi:hypothetical protein
MLPYISYTNSSLDRYKYWDLRYHTGLYIVKNKVYLYYSSKSF